MIELPNHITKQYDQALDAAYREARCLRRRVLEEGLSSKPWDGRGLHVYSQEWGRVFALEDAFPGLGARRGDTDPRSMRDMAKEEVNREFARDLIARAAA